MIDSPPYAEYDAKNWLQPTAFSRILLPGEINNKTFPEGDF